MKTSVAAVSILAFVITVSVQVDGNLMRTIRQCKKKTGCNENIANLIRYNGDIQTEACYCAIGCFAKETGFFTDDNGLNGEKLKDLLSKIQFPEDTVESILENCQSESADNECEAATNLLTCMKDQA